MMRVSRLIPKQIDSSRFECIHSRLSSKLNDSLNRQLPVPHSSLLLLLVLCQLHDSRTPTLGSTDRCCRPVIYFVNSLKERLRSSKNDHTNVRRRPVRTEAPHRDF